MITVIEIDNPTHEFIFNTMGEAKRFIRNNPNFQLKINTLDKPTSKPLERKAWKKNLDFSDAIEITRQNVRNFYNKSGYIQVVDANGTVLHTGRTTNMGKIFSNYVNCAKYLQSYDFKLEYGDKLFFKEHSLD